MNDPLLRARLGPLARRHRQLQWGCLLAVCWLATTLAGLVATTFLRELGLASPLLLPLLASFGLLAALYLTRRTFRTPANWRLLACHLERRYPDLDGRLLTAVQLATPLDAEPRFLERRLVNETLDHSYRHPWKLAIPASRVATAHTAHLLALFLVTFTFLRLQPTAAQPRLAPPRLPAGITVSPGHTTLERGETLVVMARFGGPLLPATVELVLLHPDGATRRLPLIKSLADPIFGGSVPGVTAPFQYHLEFADDRTPPYQVTVFEHPRLERADADLTFPAYTRLAPKRLEDTQRLTAVEGTRVDLALQLNKPVSSARLTPADPQAPALDLAPDPARPVATLTDFPLTRSQTYRLELLDPDGRTNKHPALFVFQALTNRPPELKIIAPRGDLRPSPLEEIVFEGSAWDDFGLLAHGLAYTLAGHPTRFIELGQNLPPRELSPFRHLLPLEDLAVQPDHLLSWYLWADDLGPDGQPRRTTSDLFFAEIRPFEEIFREGPAGQDGDPSESSPTGQPGQENSPSARLTELQKQIISATWKLQREHGAASPPAAPPPPPAYTQDATVVRDAQAQALDQATQAAQETEDPRTTAFWKTATDAMQKALAELQEALESPAPLPQALAAEQSAYQALLRLQQREFEVARSRNRSQGQSAASRSAQRQRQLDQLELTQSENRYETQRQAQAPAETERREQLQIQNRLAELARRQQDLNERLRELQTALPEAQSATEREETRRELQRLQEEQRRLLADLDELDQRLDRPENQSRLAESRPQLEQARQDMQRAADATEQGATSQALAAGTRAQRRVQDLRDDLRRTTAGEFAEDLRDMRAEARDLARQQEQIADQLQQLDPRQRRRLDDSAERQELARQLARQTSRLTNLVARATQVSQQAEPSEPLASQHLYDSLRQFHQDETATLKEFQEELFERGLMTRSLFERLEQTAAQPGAQTLELTSELLQQGLLPQADRAEQRARSGLDQLRRGIERAAERVLGDDTESLRLAQRELEQLTDQLDREAAQAQTGSPEAPPPTAPEPARTPGTPGQADEPGDPAPPAGATPSLASESAPDTPRPPAAAPGTPSGRPTPDQPNTPAPTAGGRGGVLTDALDRWLDADAPATAGPLTGPDFAPWSDRLREVEEMVEFPSLRSDLARARERARQFRQDFRRDLQKPDWAVVQLEIVRPLVEVRQQITEELARRQPADQLVPIDRDPVPGRFAEPVRRYYEQLGRTPSGVSPHY